MADAQTTSKGGKSPDISTASSSPSPPSSVARKKHRHESSVWPDPISISDAPEKSAVPLVDDISRLNATQVERILQPRTVQDVQAALAVASRENRQVCVRGTQHSMGGQSIVPNGIVLDMRHFNRLQLDPKRNVVVAGVGAQWTDLIRYLNEFGLSPRTMQSYSSFSVGGTLSVNAHGITTDHCLAESVVEFHIVLADGRELNCARDSQGEAKELFSLALGGYGLFGVITEATLKVNENVHLQLDLLRLTPKEFPRVYETLLNADPDHGGDVDIKLARLDITTLDSIELYVFRRASSVKTVSSLTLKPREMSLPSRLIYKWLAPTMQELRFTVERALGAAFDWSAPADRNSMMYESAVPLAKLYSPLFNIDDTFILQEFFVPRKRFARWMDLAKPIYKKLSASTLVSLLNTTIRFVKHDSDTVLAYSRDSEGAYAFVLYYRLRRTPEADAALKGFHEAFAKVALELGGTFYLPYRHHYTQSELELAYGRSTLEKFVQAKESFDPTCSFSSLWFNHYCLAYASGSYRKLALRQKPKSLLTADITPFSVKKDYEPSVVSERRTDSYRRLFANPRLRREFLEEFLVSVFNIEDPNNLFRLISRAVWDPNHSTDLDVYAFLQEELAKDGGGFKMLGKTWAQLKQLRQQKEELTKETVAILSRLGKMGQINDYVSVGDNGKLILPLRDALDMRGQFYVVHDVPATSLDIPVVLERGSVDPLGKFVAIDYKDVDSPSWNIPDASIDLVTMNQGLHHLPRDQIMRFLAQVRRILRPSGLFIVREHNARPFTKAASGEVQSNTQDLIPMLDLAHSVFNVVTGVSLNDERTEIRAFRSVQEWREIVEAAGFVDTMLSEVQSDDPTLDEMLCFYKPPFVHYPPRTDLPAIPFAKDTPPFLPALTGLLKTVPSSVFALMKSVVEGLVEKLPKLSASIVEYAKSTSSAGVSNVLQQTIERITGDLKGWLERFRPFFESTEMSGDIPLDILPPEIFLIVPALNRKVEQGAASPMEMVAAALIQDIQRAIMAEAGSGEAPSKPPVTAAPKTTAFTREVVLKKIDELQRAVPRLSESRILDDLDLPEIARRALKSYWAASETAKEMEALISKDAKAAKPDHSLAPLADAFVSYLDVTSWKELSSAIDEIIKHRANPTKFTDIVDAASSEATMKGNSPTALYARALSAILGSPLVYFNRTMLFQARLIGYGGVYDAWQLAQKNRKADLAKSAGPLMEAIQPLTQSPIYEASMDEGNFKDIHHVAEIISATYGYTSLTATPSDVTEEITKRLRDGTVHLADLSPHDLDKSRKVLVPALDFARKAITLNTSRLRLRYRVAQDSDPSFMSRVETLLDRLSECGIVKSLHKNDGHLTWFKLPEWMQVEITQIFGQSMNHTPWYRFPFMDFIGLYFQVLMKEINVVRQEHGLAKAIMSNAFLTDFVPGIVMFFLFGQLQLLALPVKAVGGAEYSSPELMVEQIVLLIPGVKKVDWKKLDARIVSAEQAVEGEGLFVLTVPTFKPLTEILLKIAKEYPGSQVLQISNQRQIQVKLLLPEKANTDEKESAVLSKIKAVGGCSVMFSFRYPVDGSPSIRPPLCVSVKASTTALMRLVTTAWQLGIEVQQIYDFFT